MHKRTFLMSVSALIAALLNAQNALLIRPDSIRLESERSMPSGVITGYHLYVKKSEGLESVMLTETTKDPEGKEDNYAYRAFQFNDINGDEKRVLDGSELVSEYSKFSLIDSTEEDDEMFGKAFHIFIPSTMEYGYPWSRNGMVRIRRGTFVNLRAFAKKYGDYSGVFYENPYMFDLAPRTSRELPPEHAAFAQLPAPEADLQPTVLTDDYNPIATAKFEEISERLIYSRGPDTIVEDIMSAIKEIQPKDNAEIVFVIDTTGSMKDDIEKLRGEWLPRLIKGLQDFKKVRLGLLLYRDYGSDYHYKGIPVKFFDFTDDTEVFTQNLNGFAIRGTEGGDIPEAVYEGLFGALDFYKWSSTAAKKIVLIGDAEPHPSPRGSGKYTKDLVLKTAKKKNITISAIITPDEKARRGR